MAADAQQQSRRVSPNARRPPPSLGLCRIAGLNQNNTAKPDKTIKPTVKQNCFSKLFYGKHNFNLKRLFLTKMTHFIFNFS
jgi:hypothetical protein